MSSTRAVLRDVDIGGQRGAAEGAEIDGKDDVARGAEAGGERAGGVELDPVPLAVVEGEGMAGKALAACGGEAGGGVESSAQQANGRDGIGHQFRIRPTGDP